MLGSSYPGICPTTRTISAPRIQKYLSNGSAISRGLITRRCRLTPIPVFRRRSAKASPWLYREVTSLMPRLLRHIGVDEFDVARDFVMRDLALVEGASV